jgi:50S ribosomal protein L16 3-hydroxylase
LTCSIGFRAPAWRELIEPWFDKVSADPQNAHRYTDHGVPPTRTPARLPTSFVEATLAALARTKPTRTQARDVLLTFLTEPKVNIVFVRPARALSTTTLRAAALRRGLRLDPRTRMLYANRAIAINGELLEVGARDPSLMHLLADQRMLASAQARRLAASWWQELAAWHRAGWLHLD